MWNRWSQHTHTVYVDLLILSIARTWEESKPFPYESRHSSISIIAQALDFPTVYINFQPMTELLTPTTRLVAVGMNEIYILKNNLSTTATSNILQRNNNIKLFESHLAFGTINLTSYVFAL